jgi:xylose isomerase
VTRQPSVRRETKAKIQAKSLEMPSAIEFFPDIPSISYKPVESPSSGNDKDVLCFQHYNPGEVILGKTMKEWLKFSVCYWHTFRGTGMDPFGSPTLINRPWETEASQAMSAMDVAKRRVDAAFEFFQKLGIEYYTFHDTDVSPEGETLDETLSNFAEMVDYLKSKQVETGIKLLWATQNLFSHPRYMHGAGTSPDLQVFCWAAAQVQAVMDANSKLGGANHVFWGGREGCTFTTSAGSSFRTSHSLAHPVFTLLDFRPNPSQHRPPARVQPHGQVVTPCCRVQGPEGLHGAVLD